MNYYQPRELMDKEGKPTGLWHYTCQNDGRVWAVGYCSPWETCPDCKGRSGLLRLPDHPPCERCGDKGILQRETPCPGHATPDEAREHYRQYLLDNARYDVFLADQQQKCEICHTWTDGLAEVSHEVQHVLCDDHRNRRGLSRVLKVGDVISSY